MQFTCAKLTLGEYLSHSTHPQIHKEYQFKCVILPEWWERYCQMNIWFLNILAEFEPPYSCSSGGGKNYTSVNIRPAGLTPIISELRCPEWVTPSPVTLHSNRGKVGPEIYTWCYRMSWYTRTSVPWPLTMPSFHRGLPHCSKSLLSLRKGIFTWAFSCVIDSLLEYAIWYKLSLSGSCLRHSGRVTHAPHPLDNQGH